MNKISILDSLRFRIVTMSSRAAAACALIAVAMIADWIFGASQFIYFYIKFGVTDVPPGYFFTLFPVFLGSFLLIAALVLSSLLLRLRIRYWVRQLTVFAHYKPQFMPAYAGLLLDYSFNYREVYATLMDLHFRGAIRIELENNQLCFEVINPNLETLNGLERAVIDAAIQYGGSEATCQRVLRLNFETNRRSEHFLDFGLDYKIIKKADFTLFSAGVIGGFYATVSTLASIFFFEGMISLLPEHYPVTIFHLVIIGTLSLMAAVVISTGLFPRFNSSHKQTNVSAWMFVAGWKYYLQVVYKDRMSLRGIFTQDPDEIKYGRYFIYNLQAQPVSWPS